MDDEKEVQQQLLAKWITQRDNLSLLIEALQIELGEVDSSLEARSTRAPTPRSGSLGRVEIRPDEFFGMSQMEAAYAYLKTVRHAVHLDQILEALRSGGVKFTGQEPKTTLYTVLVRGTRRFVLVSPSTFGLLEFYPSRPRPEKKQPGKKGRKPRGRGKGERGVRASKREREEPQSRTGTGLKALPAPIEHERERAPVRLAAH